MFDSVRCPACDASNPAGAEWCGQCYQKFDDGSSAVTVDPIVTAAVEAVEDRSSSSDWTCRVCESANPIEASVCLKCGHEIYDSFATPAARRSAPLWALILPGGGLFAVGQPLAGASVAGLVALGGSFGVLFITGGRPIGWLFLAVAVALWLIGARDAIVVGTGSSDVLLRPRVLSIAAVLVFAAIVFVLVEALQAVQDQVAE